MKKATFIAELKSIDDLAEAGISDEYRNPLLTWVKLVFADDQPNANHQGIKQEEFPNLIRSMAFMPIKTNYSSSEADLQGHDGAAQIGVLKEGQQEANKVVAVGALWNDEFPEVIDFFKNEIAEGRSVEFSWEIRYKDSEQDDEVEWLKEITTRAITAVKTPAYEGRTPLVSISSFDFVKAIDDELKKRGEIIGVK